ncbi:MAG: GTP-binding protein, partial [Dysgonamonadaceae bacterium]|nr:GTP-binding protein [Dysgonamonadaceae bacterium]
MNKISEIHPGKLVGNTNDWFRGLLRSLLIRTNFMVNVRHRLGWRGLKATVKNEEGWTCRIHNSKGVYGIAFDHSQKNNGWFLGNYKVYYFPNKEEEDVLDQFSLEAAVACQQPEYISYLRDFLCYPDFASLFEIATIQLSISEDQQAVICSLNADEFLTTISSTDVYWEVDGEKKMLIEQGDVDQNLPAFELALPLFNVLAATLTYNLKEKPAFLKQIRTNNDKGVENRSELIELSIGYNVDWFSENDSFLSKEDSSNSKIEHFWDSKTGGQVPFEDNIYWYAHLQKSSRFEKSHVDAEEAPQFILLTGFLGSGKTTFLKNFIEYHTANNRFVAVIQNEIGETGLDGKLLEDNYAVLEMDEGCVCCSLIGQLKKGIL